MKVLHVISSLSRTGGGPSRSAQGLVAGLNRTGVETWLMTLRKGEQPWVEGVEHFVDGKPFEEVILMVKPQIVHLHGIWDTGLHRCAVICRRLGIKYVIAPRGMLEQWSLKQKWLKKRMARLLYQDKDLKCAAALHATAECEADQFRKLGFKNPVIISPNGVNVPKLEGSDEINELELKLKTQTNSAVRRVLFVSRMHPKKGVRELVEAWNVLKHTTHNSQLTNWVCELVYTVNGDLERNYESEVRNMVKELRLEDQFIFTGALSDDEKWQAYARADLFVLPTYSENFGIVVAEALWAGVPVITTKGTPWSDIEAHKCGWWIDVGVKPLVNALQEALSLSDVKRHEMGGCGHRLVEKKYTWDAVVEPVVDGYERILG